MIFTVQTELLISSILQKIYSDGRAVGIKMKAGKIQTVCTSSATIVLCEVAWLLVLMKLYEELVS